MDGGNSPSVFNYLRSVFNSLLYVVASRAIPDISTLYGRSGILLATVMQIGYSS